jgi:hypothetical protein
MSITSQHPALPPVRAPEARTWKAMMNLERRIARVEAFFTGGQAQAIPASGTGNNPAGRRGRLVCGDNNDVIYFDNGSTWLNLSGAQSRSSLPGAAVAGRLVWRSSDGTLWVEDGAAWHQVTIS